MKNIFTLATVLILLLACDNTNASERYSFMGFQPAYLVELPDEFPKLSSNYVVRERIVEVDLLIDKKGRVTEVIPIVPIDSTQLIRSKEYIAGIKFEPARFNGKKVKSRLPVRVHLWPHQPVPVIYTAIDETGEIVTDRDLFMRACEYQKLYLAKINSFPVYFCDLEISDSIAVYPYVLLKLNLSETGEVVAIEDAGSSYGSFVGQIKSAILYAKFTPAMLKGQAVASEPLLLVRFFPHLTYPTRPPEPGFDQAKFLDYFQVELIPGKIGLLSKPIPVGYPGDLLPLKRNAQRRIVDLSVAIYIDQDGHSFSPRISKADILVRQGVRQSLNSLRFYPAIQFNGAPVKFDGLLEILLDGSANIRIDYLWQNLAPRNK